AGFTHFVVAWRAFAGWVQIMDPASGRRWLSAERFLRELYVHEMEVPASTFVEIGASDAWARAVARRLDACGCKSAARGFLAASQSTGDWRPLACLDAALRMTETLVRARALARGREAQTALSEWYERALASEDAIPMTYWTARGGRVDATGEAQITLRG